MLTHGCLRSERRGGLIRVHGCSSCDCLLGPGVRMARFMNQKLMAIRNEKQKSFKKVSYGCWLAAAVPLLRSPERRSCMAPRRPSAPNSRESSYAEISNSVPARDSLLKLFTAMAHGGFDSDLVFCGMGVLATACRFCAKFQPPEGCHVYSNGRRM